MSLTHHLEETRNVFAQAEDSLTDVAGGVNRVSEKLNKANITFKEQNSLLHKSGFFLTGIRKQHKKNILMVYGSFFFLIMSVVFIIIRRLFYPNFYSVTFQQVRSLVDL